jgi:hypothetical protein
MQKPKRVVGVVVSILWVACANSTDKGTPANLGPDGESAGNITGQKTEPNVYDARNVSFDSSDVMVEAGRDTSLSFDTSFGVVEETNVGRNDGATSDSSSYDVAPNANEASWDDWRKEFWPCPKDDPCGYSASENCPPYAPCDLPCDEERKNCYYCSKNTNEGKYPSLLVYCLSGLWWCEGINGIPCAVD